jgi:hypothetical protein
MQRLARTDTYRRIPAQSVNFRSALQILAVLIFASLHPRYCAAQQERPTESQVKAAYIYNFGKFVRWQPSAPRFNSFDICVLGKNPFGSVLQTTVSGETIDGKSILVKNIANTGEAVHCSILFISSSEESGLKPILSAARPLNVLTVSDIPAFAQRGGMIELVSQAGRIRFAVNLDAASDAGLNVSSELLKVAVRVIQTKKIREIDK